MYFESEISIPLKKEGYLTDAQNKLVFVERLAHYFDHVNAAHPFREGNGRTQREFFRTLALMNGYNIDWENTTSDEMNESSRLSLEKRNLMGLEKLILKCVTNNTPDAVLINFF